MNGDAFNEELDKARNSPENILHREVKAYVASRPYQTYANVICSFDSVVDIYSRRYKVILEAMHTLYVNKFDDDAGVSQLDVLLTDALAELHSYLSSVFSLMHQLRKHARKQVANTKLIAECDTLAKSPIIKFFNVFNDYIFNGAKFSTLMQFNSGSNEPKLLYDAQDFLSDKRWEGCKDFIAGCGHIVTIDELIPELDRQVRVFFERYEKILFDANAPLVTEVLQTLFGFSSQYKAMGTSGVLPVSNEYLDDKIRRFL